MPRFAANLSMMFTDVPFLDRFDAAAKAGFTAVEFLFPYDHPAEAVGERLQKNGLTQALFNLRLLCQTYFNVDPLVVGEPNVKLGMQVLLERPQDAGADRDARPEAAVTVAMMMAIAAASVDAARDATSADAGLNKASAGNRARSEAGITARCNGNAASSEAATAAGCNGHAATPKATAAG